MKILIVGAGIAGLTLYNNLSDVNFEIDIIEKANNFNDNNGYVVGIWSNGLEILRKMNLNDFIKRYGFESQFQLLTDENSKTLRYTDLVNLNLKHNSVVLFFERGDLLNCLLQVNDAAKKIQFEKEILSLSEDNKGVDVLFTDNTFKRYDLVIGADGVNSSVRKKILSKSSANVLRSSFFYYTTIAPANLPKLSGDVEMLGKGKFLGIYPCKNNRIGVFGSFSTLNKKADINSVIKNEFSDFKGFSDYAISNIDDVQNIFVDKMKDVKCHKWYTNRCLLVGDAAHALLPFSGQGVSLALEDAYILADIIKKNNKQPFVDIFKMFVDSRTKKISKIQLKARLTQKVISLKTRVICKIRNMLIYYILFKNKKNTLDKFFNSN